MRKRRSRAHFRGVLRKPLRWSSDSSFWDRPSNCTTYKVALTSSAMSRKNSWQGRGRLLAGWVTCLLLLWVAACGDSSGKATSPAPEDLRASAATVAAGLKQIETTSASIATAAATDKSRAKDLDGQIEPVWM